MAWNQIAVQTKDRIRNQLHAIPDESIALVSPLVDVQILRESADKVLITNNENELGTNSAECIGAVSLSDDVQTACEIVEERINNISG